MAYIAGAGYEKVKKVVGNGQCVALLKALTGAPALSLWRKGGDVSDLVAKACIAEGTAIATFMDGRYLNLNYGNHAAIFVREVGVYLEVFDQYKGAMPKLRRIRFGLPEDVSRVKRAEAYSVVL